MPRIENTITLGNFISLIGTLFAVGGLVAGMFLWGGRLSERAEGFDREILRLRATSESHEARIRGVEQMSARQDERLVLILDALRKIEARMDAQ